MKQKQLLKPLFLLCALLVGGLNSVWADEVPVTLFHETFGDNSGKARDWIDTYSVKSGVEAVYSGITSYTVENVKQGKNTTGSTGSGLNQFTAGTDASIIIGPLNVANYNTLVLTYQWKAASIKGSYSTSLYYATSSNGEYTAVNGTGDGATTFVERSYSLPTAAQVSTLYLKIVWNTSNTQAIIDEVNLSGYTGLVTFSVTYNGNGNTSGTVPTDATAYSSGATVTVLGNTGNLSKSGYVFDGWNTLANGEGTNYSAGSSFSITANTTLFAKWTDIRTSAELEWSSSSATVTYGADDNIFPTLTNPHNVSVTYASTNEDAATIDASTGEITLKDVSANLTTYITATFDGNDDYKDQTVGYTLTVNKAPFAIKDGVFDFVEAAKQEPLADYGSGMTLGSDYTTTSKTWTAGNVTMVTSKTSGNGYRWWSADGTLRFYNGSNATFSVPDGYVITKIVTTGAGFNNANVGTLSGMTWTGASNEVKLSVTQTKEIKTITVTYRSAIATFTISCEGGYASYSCDIPLDFSNSGAEAYIIKSSTENSASLTKVTKVPANTGIIVKGTKGEEVNVSMATGDMDDVEGNLLHGTVNTPKDVAQDEAYGLSKADGLFHLMNAGTIPVNKAYLLASEVFQGTASPVLVLDFDSEATAIDDVRSKTEDVRGDFYNLNGQRVAQPTKGLYIVNGKKYIVK